MNRAKNVGVERRGTWRTVDKKQAEISKNVQDEIWAQFFEKKSRKPVQVRRRFKAHPTTVRSDSENSELPSPDQSCSSDSCKALPNMSRGNKRLNEEEENKNETNNNSILFETKPKTPVEVADIEKKDGENVAILFERPTKSKEIVNQQDPGRRADKFKSTSDIKPKRSKTLIDDNIDLKMKSLFPKILRAVDNIRGQMSSGIPLPDGEEDYQRKKKRAAEFSSRLSRNYLYQLGRETNDLEKAVRSNAGCCSSGAHRKFITAYQVIYQALQAFQSHMQNTLPNSVSRKLNELILKSQHLCELHLKALKNNEGNYHLKIDDLITKLLTELQGLQDNLDNYSVVSAVTLLQSNSTKLSLAGSRIEKLEKPDRSKGQCMKSKLSMYNESACFRRDMGWKKVSAILAKRSQGVQSRYKTATFKHRPPVEKPHILTMPPRNKLFIGKLSSEAIQNSPLASPFSEEKVVTMVEIENEKNKKFNSRQDIPADEKCSQDDVKDVVRELVNKVASEGKVVSQDGMQRILRDVLSMVRDGGKDGVKMERLVALHDALEARVDGGRDRGAARELLRKMEGEEEGQGEGEVVLVEKRSERKITVREFGSKNAKLICIKDENSICEPEPEQPADAKEENPKKNEPVRVSSETQTQTVAAPVQQKMNVKISRLPKRSFKPLQLLPKEYMFAIAQYKLSLYDHNKTNCLYMKSAMVKPWLMMGNISDTVLESLLLSVAKEMELNDVLENLYQSEFQ